MRLRGLSAIVTGAGTGIGAAVAGLLAREGAAVVACGRRREPLETTVAACVRAGARARACPLDVRDEPALERAFDLATTLGDADIAVASHGINRLALVDEMPAAVWEEVLSVNLTGAFLVARAAARRMRARGRGRILLVSSVSGRPGTRKYSGFAAYAASKYGLQGLIEVLAVELEGSGVSVTGLCPGGVDTEMFRSTFPGARASLTPGAVAAAVLDLVAPDRPARPGVLVDLPG